MRTVGALMFDFDLFLISFFAISLNQVVDSSGMHTRNDCVLHFAESAASAHQHLDAVTSALMEDGAAAQKNPRLRPRY